MGRARSVLSKAAAKLRMYYQYAFSAALIILLVLIVYGRDLEILFNEALHSEALTHIILIPFFVSILFYFKKDVVLASLALMKQRKKIRLKYIDEVTGVALCLVAFLIYWYGSHTFYALEYHFFSLPIFVMGITLVLFNSKTLTTLILPILFLLFLIPPPTELMYTIGGVMANFNTHASYSLLEIFGLPVTLSLAYGPPTIILTPVAGHSEFFAIDLACSGIYSLIAFAMLAVFLAFLVSTSIPKKIALSALGFLIFEALNIIRIATIISIAHWFGTEIAMFTFHALAGFVLIFIGMVTTLFLAEKFLKITTIPKPRQTQPCTECQTYLQSLEAFCGHCGKFFSSLQSKISQKSWMKLIILLIGCSMATAAVHAPTFAFAQETISITAGYEQATNIFPAALEYQNANYTLLFLYRNTNFEKMVGQDASLTYAYFPDNKSKAVVYALVGVSGSFSKLHSWEVCLITWQTAQGRHPLVTTLESRDIQLLTDTPLIARYLVFYDNRTTRSYTQVTLYWYERAAFNTGRTVEQRYVRISLIIIALNSTNYQQYENELLAVGQDVMSHWQPLETQALISLGIPAQQLLLASSIAFVVVTKSAQYSNERRKRNLNFRLFNTQASPKEKTALEVIVKLSKEKENIETRDIRNAIAQKTKKQVNLNTLLKVLGKLEEYDFIKREIIRVDNRPTVVWRTQIFPLYKS